MIRYLERHGYELMRVRGSHHFFRSGQRHTTVPAHGNRPLKIGTLRSILRDIDVAPSDFIESFRHK